jgi:3-deoxy-7-phosphoheptulonate synthase
MENIMNSESEIIRNTQQPNWPDLVAVEDIRSELFGNEPLSRPEDVHLLTEILSDVNISRSFVLQAGPCAESFSNTAEFTLDLISLIFEMSDIIQNRTGVTVTKIGRIAGQYCKPRSLLFETQDGFTLPSFRGDIVNDHTFSELARTPDPSRMLRAYEHARSNIELIESETKELKLFTSHETLLLDYESALIRLDGKRNLYGSSAHMLWIGDRTRHINSPHVEFCKGIVNPIGVKVGPNISTGDILSLCEILNPNRVAGRLSFIVRMGKDIIKAKLPPIMDIVNDIDHPVIWISDPMHGNTITTDSGKKTRRFEDITTELQEYFRICEITGTNPGGVHLEITGEDVTECLGGNGPATSSELDRNYTTTCDPRLNPAQSIELAAFISGLISIHCEL